MKRNKLGNYYSVEVRQITTAMPACGAKFVLKWISSECHPEVGSRMILVEVAMFPNVEPYE